MHLYYTKVGRKKPVFREDMDAFTPCAETGWINFNALQQGMYHVCTQASLLKLKLSYVVLWCRRRKDPPLSCLLISPLADGGLKCCWTLRSDLKIVNTVSDGQSLHYHNNGPRLLKDLEFATISGIGWILERRDSAAARSNAGFYLKRSMDAYNPQGWLIIEMNKCFETFLNSYKPAVCFLLLPCWGSSLIGAWSILYGRLME